MVDVGSKLLKAGPAVPDQAPSMVIVKPYAPISWSRFVFSVWLLRKCFWFFFGKDGKFQMYESLGLFVGFLLPARICFDFLKSEF